MKTNNLTKKSFLTSLIMMFTAGLHGGREPIPSAPNVYAGGGSPIYTPHHTKIKGWMKEKRRSTFNKNR